MEKQRCPFCNKRVPLNPKSEDCKRCELPWGKEEHLFFPSLSGPSYQHPLDAQALEGLKKIPGVDMILKRFLSLTHERSMKVLYRSHSVRVGPNQYPKLYQKHKIACQTLNIPEPELYVALVDPLGSGLNAFTGGVDKPFIVISAQLLERLSPLETLALLGHEMGHIHSEHLLYKVAADTLIMLSYQVLGKTAIGGFLNTIGLPLQLALITWRHKSELSCDRAALVTAQDKTAVLSLIMKLAGGSLGEKVSLEAFIEQARQFEKDYQEDWLDKFWTLLLSFQSSHPLPVWRILELLKWEESGLYQKCISSQLT